ncbi:MAG: chromate transporter [Candidatus Brocadiia bacterium]
MSQVKAEGGDPRSVSYLRLFWIYFRIGLMTFGGGFAMATVLRHELVLKRKWLTDKQFVNALSAATAIPGAIAVNLAFVQGRRSHGMRGAITAAVGTMCPSVLVILLIARFGAPYFQHPIVAAFLKGCAIAVTGQIAFATFTFARRLRRHWQNVVVCGLALFVLILGAHPVWAVVVAAALGYLLMHERMTPRERAEEELELLKLIEAIPAQELLGDRFEKDLEDVIREPDDGVGDRFDAIMERCPVVDLEGPMGVEEFLDLAADELAENLRVDAETLAADLKKREAASSTVVDEWLAVPHVVIEGEGAFKVLVARSRAGVRFSEQTPEVQAIFVVVGSLDERDFYLFALAAIGQVAASDRFRDRWLRAEGTQELRRAILSARAKNAE